MHPLPPAPLALLRSELHGPYDAVIIAAPLESASITFKPPAAASGASSLGAAGSLQEEKQAQGQGQEQEQEQEQERGQEGEDHGNSQHAGGGTEQGGRSIARVCRWLRCVSPAAGHTTDGNVDMTDGGITDGAGAVKEEEGHSGADAVADGASVGGAASGGAAGWGGLEQGEDVGEEGASGEGLEGAGSRRLSMAGDADAVQKMEVAQAARTGGRAGSKAAGQLSGRRYQQTVRGGGVLRLGLGMRCTAAGHLPLHSLSSNTTLRHPHHQA